jgi:hypothetical protein
MNRHHDALLIGREIEDRATALALLGADFVRITFEQRGRERAQLGLAELVELGAVETVVPPRCSSMRIIALGGRCRQ